MEVIMNISSIRVSVALAVFISLVGFTRAAVAVPTGGLAKPHIVDTAVGIVAAARIVDGTTLVIAGHISEDATTALTTIRIIGDAIDVRTSASTSVPNPGRQST
jgi:hypothetical protein